MYVCVCVCVCVSLAIAKPLHRSSWKLAHILTTGLGKNYFLRFSINFFLGFQILFSQKKPAFLLFFNISLDIIELESWFWCLHVGFRGRGIEWRDFEKCQTNRVASRVARSLIFLFFNISIGRHRRWFSAVLTALQLFFGRHMFWMNYKFTPMSNNFICACFLERYKHIVEAKNLGLKVHVNSVLGSIVSNIFVYHFIWHFQFMRWL